RSRASWRGRSAAASSSTRWWGRAAASGWCCPRGTRRTGNGPTPPPLERSATADGTGLVLLDQVAAHRDRDRLRPRLRVELAHGVADVRAHRVGRDAERAADRVVAVAVGEEAQHAALPLAQRRLAAAGLRAHEHARERAPPRPDRPGR